MCKLPYSGPSCTRHTRAPGPACSLAPTLEGLLWAPPKRASEPGAGVPPLTARLAACLCIQPSPGSGRDPNASWACTSTNLALALATRGAEEQKTWRSLPPHKRQPMTPQKKTAFPSVSLQTNGRQGPGCRSNPESPKGTIDTQGRRARCKQLPPTGRPSKVWLARWPSVSK